LSRAGHECIYVFLLVERDARVRGIVVRRYVAPIAGERYTMPSDKGSD